MNGFLLMQHQFAWHTLTRVVHLLSSQWYIFLQDLVPESCCRIIGHSHHYRESFTCNFLGLSVGVELPPHVVASEHHILLDILPPLTRHYSRSIENLQVVSNVSSNMAVMGRGSPGGRDLLSNYKLMVYSALPRVTEQKCMTSCCFFPGLWVLELFLLIPQIHCFFSDCCPCCQVKLYLILLWTRHYTI